MSISQIELDPLIFAAIKPWGTKVAAVMAHVDSSMRALGRLSEVDFDEIEQRLRTLVDSGCLHADGDLSKWRFSEVRMPVSAPL